MVRALLCLTSLILAIAWPVACPAAEVRVDGRLLSVNGVAEVPRGLFGVHAFPVNPQTRAEFGIDCFRQITGGSSITALERDGSIKPNFQGLAVSIDCLGDRYQQATVLTNPDYEAQWRQHGKRYGEKAKAAAEAHGYQAYVEFWNEPYLNWASRSHGGHGSHYNARFYDVAKATDDGPVTIKGWDKPLESLRWRRLWAGIEETDKTGKKVQRIYWGVQVPAGLKPGDTFLGRSPANWYWTDRSEKTFTVVETWNVYDPTQVSFWSGRQNLQFYLWMFLPFAEEVKKVHPQVRVIAGWGFGQHHGDWAVFRELTQPIIDQGIQWLDGINDHHYGGDTRMVTAQYEVVTAYAMNKHRKWLRGYNTECGAPRDPAMWGAEAFKDQPADELVREMGHTSYHLRDMIELLHHSPCKVGSRTAQPVGEKGMFHALKFLRDFRGRLVRATADDLALWPTAALADDKLLLLVYNDSSQAREVNYTVEAPRGLTFAAGTVHWLEPDAKAGQIAAREAPLPASGTTASLKHTLGPQQAVKIVLPVTGKPPAGPQVERKQFFAREGVLHPLPAGRPLTITVPVDAATLARAQAARLRLVLEGRDLPRLKVLLNGVAVPIPARDWTMDLAVDLKQVKADNTLTLEWPAGIAEACNLCAASILVEVPVE